MTLERQQIRVGQPPSQITLREEEQVGPKEASRSPHAVHVSNIGDRVFNGVTATFAGLILAILAIMVGILASQAWPTISKFGLRFVTDSTWDVNRNIYGAAPAILGTIYTSVLAVIAASIVGVLTAVFLTEMAPQRIRFPLGFLVELLAAVPSIVYGLWALFVLVPFVRVNIQPPLIDHFGNTQLFSGYPLGLGVFTASLILTVMILPTIAAISRDVILAVPNQQREAMLALGATRWETTWKVVIPYARSGIIGGIILGLGRAVGETMAVQMVIGNSQTISPSLFNLGTTITATLVNQFNEATATLHRSALVELALILMLVTVFLNIVARLLVWSVTRKYAA